MNDFWNIILGAQARRFAAAIFVICMIFCLGRTIWNVRESEAERLGIADCRMTTDAALPLDEDFKGVLRIQAVHARIQPKDHQANGSQTTASGKAQAEFPGTLCIVVAGVMKSDGATSLAKATESEALAVADAKANLGRAPQGDKSGAEQTLRAKERLLEEARDVAIRRLQPVKLSFFLDNQRVCFLSRTVPQTPYPQAILIRMANGDSESCEGNIKVDPQAAWRTVLGNGRADGVHGRKLRIGIARDAIDQPEAWAPQDTAFALTEPYALAAGAGALAAFLLVLASFARGTTLLRDSGLRWREARQDWMARIETSCRNDLKLASDADVSGNATYQQLKADRERAVAHYAETRRLDELSPVAPFSLAKTQIALWSVIVFTCTFFIWLALGDFSNLITPSTLSLMGIQIATTIAAINMPASESAKAQVSAISTGFWTDVTSDSQGPQFQRINALAWTLLMAAAFLWTALTAFRFREFDPNLLILMAMASTTYVLMKPKEGGKPAPANA